MSRPLLKEEIAQKAFSLGFHLFGVSRAGPFPEMSHFNTWLEKGYAAGMRYLEKRKEERMQVQRYFPEAKSVLTFGMYYAQKETKGDRAPDVPTIARYARGMDYHDIVTEKLRAIAAHLEGRSPCKTRICVDTAPVLDRVFAYHAGLGWFGKNTCLIHPRYGSYFFIGEIFLDLDLPADTPQPNHCGTCTRCLDACPTQAFPEPYVLDANRCIAYWNIEHRGEIPLSIQENMGNHFFGCDICQEVCPWNHLHASEDVSRLPTPDPAFAERENPTALVEKLRQMTPEQFASQFRRSPLKRARYEGLIRNARVIRNNGSVLTGNPT